MLKLKIKEMANMQVELNNATNGDEWIHGYNNSGRDINWMRCARMELNEAIDQSLSWKHWKDVGKEQYSYLNDSSEHNLKIELIDTWHFILSEAIAKGWVDELIKIFNSLYSGKYNLNKKELVIAIEDVQKLTFEYEYYESIDNFRELLRAFIILLLSQISFDELYKTYILKNVLNLFRQNNGYKDGTYKKIWNNREDNEYLNDYVKNSKDINLQTVYKYLEEKYNTI